MTTKAAAISIGLLEGERSKTLSGDLHYLYLLEEPLAALMSSSARHSAIVLMFLKALSLAPVVRR